MTQWEYKTFGLPYSKDVNETKADRWRIRDAWMNDFGAEGWEIVWLDFGANELLVIAKRPIARPSRYLIEPIIPP